MSFSIEQIPFSRYGSFISISYLTKRRSGKEGIYFRNIRKGDDRSGAVFKIDLIEDGQVVPFTARVHPTYLQLKTEKGFMKFVFPEEDYVRLYGENVGLRLSLVTGYYDNAFRQDEKRWQVNAFSQGMRYMLSPLQGDMHVDADWEVKTSTRVIADFLPQKSDGSVEGIIEEFLVVYEPKTYDSSFEAAHERVKKLYKDWYDKTLELSDKYDAGKQLASYITWSTVVKPEGYLPREAMYMSKNWMTNIWSWDNCFNAMALAKNNPELAWDQLMIFFDTQDESGVLADFINDQFAYWNCSKPPVHGWTLNWMMERTEFSKEKLEEIYEPLVKWTNWFKNHRTPNSDSLPLYHHGNDSGWDNSTVFDQGIPVESPDLPAFLILQMETLAKIAEKLGKYEESKDCQTKSEKLLDKMIERFWDGEKFFARYYGERVNVGDSLLLFMPIVLADRLPKDILKKLIQGLKEEGRFLTDHGLATESQRSPYYIDDGYWRGPIWAPATMLMIDGLVRSGEKEFARELANRFCQMANEYGMAENYDAKTGEGLRDRAFTWTSSVFLILGHEYC